MVLLAREVRRGRSRVEPLEPCLRNQPSIEVERTLGAIRGEVYPSPAAKPSSGRA